MAKEGNSNFTFDYSVLEGANSGMNNGVVTGAIPEIESLESLTSGMTIPIEDTKTDKTAETTTEVVKDSTGTNQAAIKEIESIKDLMNPESTDKTVETKVVETKVEEAKEEPKTPTKEDPLKVFSQNLAEAGTIDFNEEEYTAAEDKDSYLNTKVAEKIASGVETFKQEFLAELPAEINDLIELHKKGVPLHKVLEADARIAEYEEIKPETLKDSASLQKDVIRDLLTTQGWSRDKVESKINKFEDMGVLEEEASDALDMLKNIEKENKEYLIKQEIENKKQRELDSQARIKQLEETIKNKKELMGYTLSDKEKKTLSDALLKPIGKLPDGRAYNAIQKAKMDDPDAMLKEAYFWTVLKGDLSKVEKKTETKVVKKLSNIIKDDEAMAYGNNSRIEPVKSTTDMETMKKALEYLQIKR